MKKEGAQKNNVLFAVFFTILLISSVAVVSAESGNNENIFSKLLNFIRGIFGGAEVTGAVGACDPNVDPNCYCNFCNPAYDPSCTDPCCDSTCDPSSNPYCLPCGDSGPYCRITVTKYNDKNGDGVRQESTEEGLAGVFIKLLKDSTGMGDFGLVAEDWTDWEGKVEFEVDNTGDPYFVADEDLSQSPGYEDWTMTSEPIPFYCDGWDDSINADTGATSIGNNELCVPTSSSEAGYCDDEIDNDCDGLTDCEEILYEDEIEGNDDCADDPICGIVSNSTTCGDGVVSGNEKCDWGVKSGDNCCNDNCDGPLRICEARAGHSGICNGINNDYCDGTGFDVFACIDQDFSVLGSSKAMCEFDVSTASYNLASGCGGQVYTRSIFKGGTGSVPYCCGNNPNEHVTVWNVNGTDYTGCCAQSGACLDESLTCRYEASKEVSCYDGIDNDCDGDIDINDSDCGTCGDNVVIAGEDCDPGQDVEGDCCTSECKFVSSGTECRPKDGTCDVAAEVCSGSNATCPEDVLVNGDADCSACQTCDGSSKECTDISDDEDIIGPNLCNSSCDYCATGTSGNKECTVRTVCAVDECSSGNYCDGTGLHEDCVNVDLDNADVAPLCEICVKDGNGLPNGHHTYGANPAWSIFSGTGTEAHCCGDDTEFFITKGNGQPGCCNESKTTTCVSSLGHCGNTFGVAEMPGYNCNDGIDNDCNGYADADDPACVVVVCGDGKITGDEKCDPGIVGQECCIPKGQTNECNGALAVCTAASGCSTGEYCVGGTSYGCASPSDTGVEGEIVCEAECGGGTNPSDWYHIEGNSFPFYSNLATVSNFGAPCCGDAGIKEAYITNGNGQPGCCAVGAQLISSICVSSLGYCGGEYTGENTGNTDNPRGTETTCNDGKDNDCDGVYDNNFVMGPNGDIYPDPDCAGKGRQHASTTDWDGDLLANLAEGWDENDPRVAVFSDSDTQPDFIDIDSDSDGIMDDFEAFENCEDPETCPISDKDADGVYDFRDLDTDADGIPDLTEGHDVNSDGIADRVPSGNDINQNGLDAAFDPEEGGILAPLQDNDGDGTPDWRDTDDDGDGILTIDEGTGDFDGDGIPDYLDDDSDNDGVTDDIDKCLESTVNYVEALKSSHYDSSNLNLTETFGCDLNQILFCKPGNNNGEFKFGLTIGTLNVWTSQTGWALDCQVNSIVALEGESKPFFENTDNSGLIDIFDGDNDNDGISDGEDSEDDSAPVESGLEGTGKPDWWCGKHPTKC